MNAHIESQIRQVAVEISNLNQSFCIGTALIATTGLLIEVILIRISKKL